MKHIKLKSVILASFTLLLAQACNDKSAPTLTTAKPTASPLATRPPADPNRISADALYAAYDSNKVVADEKYRGRELVVTGKVWQVGDNPSSPDVWLSGAGVANAVHCTFAEGEGPRVVRLPKGGTITLIGKIDPEMSGLELVNCRLQ